MIRGQIVFGLHSPFGIIFLVRVFWALQKIIFVQFLIMDRFCWVQKNDWLLLDLIFVARLTKILLINQISEALDAIKPGWSFKNELKASLAIEVLWFTLDGLSHHLSWSRFEVI